MAVMVKAAANLYDPVDASFEVPKGTAGSVVEVGGVPSSPVYRVTFTPSSGSVTFWVSPSQLLWDDGPIGPVRAHTEGLTLTTVRFAGESADYEQRLGAAPIALAGSVELVFPGVTVTVESNRNTGDLTWALR